MRLISIFLMQIATSVGIFLLPSATSANIICKQLEINFDSTHMTLNEANALKRKIPASGCEAFRQRLESYIASFSPHETTLPSSLPQKRTPQYVIASASPQPAKSGTKTEPRPAIPITPPAPLPSTPAISESGGITITIYKCIKTPPGAECSGTIKSAGKTIWSLTGQDYLNYDGAKLPIDTMELFGTSSSFQGAIPWGNAKYVWLEPNSPAKLVMQFSGDIDPQKVDGLVIFKSGRYSTMQVTHLPWRDDN